MKTKVRIGKFSGLRSFWDKEYCENVILLSAIVFSPVKYAVSQILTLFNVGQQHISSGILWILFLVFFVFPYMKWVRIRHDAVCLFFLLSLGFSLFVFMHPEEIGLAKTLIITVIVRAFPYYVIARNVKDYEKLKLYIAPAGNIINVSMFIVYYVKSQLGILMEGGWYDMTFAYMLLPGAVIAFKVFYDRVNIWYFCWFIFDAFLLLFMGTRGPIIILLLYVVYEVLVNSIYAGSISIKKAAIFFAMVIGVFYLLFYVIINADKLIVWAASKGLSIRILYGIVNSDFMNNVGRAPIWRAAGKLILHYPLTGVGIINDRWMIAATLYKDSPPIGEMKGFYSHMVWMDWLLEFGILIGGVMIIFSIYILINVFFRKKDGYRYCMEIFIFAAFVPMFVSLHYLQTETFWILFAFSINYLVRMKEI